MKNLLPALMLLFAFALKSNAQSYETHSFDIGIQRDFPWGEYDHALFGLTSYLKDPSAGAVVGKEFGKAWITSNGNNTTLIFEYHVKIKIFDSKQLNKGHVEIPYYMQDSGTYEDIPQSSVQGLTYYATPDGAMHSVAVDPDSVTIVKKNKHWSAIIFTMPHLTKGCIIEYKYRLSSPFLDKFKTWKFQSDIPKIYSEYEVHIPSAFGYNISLTGSLALSKDTVSIEKDCFESTNIKSDCTVEDYRINDVPAFVPEPFMQSPKNYISALHFQVTHSTKLNNYVTLNEATEENVADDWTDADKTLKMSENFGSQLGHVSVLKEKTTQATTGLTDTLAKAKAIYALIQKNIVYDGLNSIYTDNGVKKAFEKHSGNSADVNIALVDALREAGIKSDPVIISTRDNGIPTSLYPALTEFNSVIAATIVGNKVYLLDATDPMLPFGILPFKDLNDRGRVVPADKPSYWIKLVNSQQSISNAVADLTLDASGKLAGTITTYSKSYAAYDRRVALSGKSDGNNTAVQGLNIANVTNNAANQNPAFTETYQVQVNNQDKSGNFTFVPFMLGKPVTQPFKLLDTLTANPFTEAKRSYPVDFGMPSAYSFTVKINLPAGYKVDNPPQNVTDSIPSIGGVNATFATDQSTATYTVTYNLDKPVYSVQEYTNLKSLFDKIILAEKAAITIKKQ